MADGVRQLGGIIRRVELLGGMAERLAPRVGEALRRETDAAVAGQRGPDGTPWPPTQSGRPALQGAARKTQVTVSGTTVSITLTGPEAMHNRGRARGGVRRQVIPSAVPASVSGLVVEEWRRTMGGGS